MGDGKPQTSPLVYVASGCGILFGLYLLLSCVVPLVMYAVMGLNGMGAGGSGSVPATPAGTPYDLGPPGQGGPMLPMDPSEGPALDAGIAPMAVPAPELAPPVS